MQINSANFSTNFGLNFGAKKVNTNNDYLKVPNGADYEILDTLDLTRSKTIPQMSESLKKGEDISADREKLIFSRLKTAIKDVQKFLGNSPKLSENPVYSNDDMVQEMAMHVVERTDSNLAKDKDIFGPNYAHDRDFHFSKVEEEQALKPNAEAKFYAGDLVPEVEEEYSKIELKEEIDKALKKLTPREKGVLWLRFGLKDGRQRTLEEVGEAFNVTRDRVRQIEAKALRKLRNPARSKNLKAFIK